MVTPIYREGTREIIDHQIRQIFRAAEIGHRSPAGQQMIAAQKLKNCLPLQPYRSSVRDSTIGASPSAVELLLRHRYVQPQETQGIVFTGVTSQAKLVRSCTAGP